MTDSTIQHPSLFNRKISSNLVTCKVSTASTEVEEDEEDEGDYSVLSLKYMIPANHIHLNHYSLWADTCIRRKAAQYICPLSHTWAQKSKSLAS